MGRIVTNVVLRKTNLGWPIIMFPYYERSHTVEYTGKEWVKDVKFAVGFATLFLTDRMLHCRLVFPRVLILEVELSDITHVSRLKDRHGILEIRFNKAKNGLLTRFALSGDAAIPKDRVLLNLGDESEIWYHELNKRVSVSREAEDAAV